MSFGNGNNIILTQRDLGNKYSQTPQKKETKKITFKNYDNPLVSIIIASCNDYQYTKSCLFYVYKNTFNVPYEVIVADDNSTDKTQKIQDEFENINFIKTTKILGFLKNVNNAAKYAKGKYICILHNDTIPKENWLEPMVKIIEEDETIGIVGAKILQPNGKISEAGFEIDYEGIFTSIGKGESSDESDFNKTKIVDYCSSCSMLVKKNIWDEIGGFDIKFSPKYYEDVDLSFNFLYKFKLKTVFQPQSEIVHFNKGYYKNTNLKYSNRLDFLMKWKKELQLKYEKLKKEKQNINICFGLTDNYSQHTGVAIASILINSNLSDNYHFYLISDYISEKNKQYFSDLKKIRDFEISFLQVDNDDFKNIKVFNHSIGLGCSSFYRFKIFDLINKDKVLYLDSDLLVRKDLRELFETDISNYLFAAVTDMFSFDCKERCKLDEEAVYVNAGVVLFNVKKCKEENFHKKLFALSEQPAAPNIIYADQDILNLLAQKRIKILDDTWNSATSIDSAIVHYFGPDEKPWLLNGKPQDHFYFEYLKFTPWHEEFITSLRQNINVEK